MSDANAARLAPIWVLGQLESVINRALVYAPATQVRLIELAGRRVGFRTQRPALQALLVIETDRISLQAHWEGPVDALVEGPLLGIVAQGWQGQPTPADLMRRGLRIRGDQALIQNLRDMALSLDLDWESALGDVVGDLAAHQVGQLARGGWRWLKQTTSDLLEQGRYAVTDEWALTIQRPEMTHFQTAVDDLRADTDRLEARLRQLSAHLSDEEN